jgi:DNA-binding beta-propeller fold protein YncE
MFSDDMVTLHQTFQSVGMIALMAMALGVNADASKGSRPKTEPVPGPPDLELSGGRKLVYERAFSSQREVKLKKGFWTRLLDVVAGAPEYRDLVRPYSVAADSRGRLIITDPGIPGVHVFDFPRQKYKFIEREGKEAFRAPQCVAVDERDNFYVTDSEAGKIFVFDAESKFRRVIGSIKGGEGYFKRPTGIAVDSAANRLYVSDTLRHKIFVLDMDGNILQTIGQNGSGNGEFNFPTELRLTGDELIVVDAMNFRVQVLDRSGTFHYSIGDPGDANGAMFRPKGIALDSEHHLYVVDGLWGIVQVFDREGQLLYYFGQSGDAPGDFNLPSGLFIDRSNLIYVVDSFNRRVQVFHYFGPMAQTPGGTP